MTGFFDLPAELRLYTYEIALADAIKAPVSPWDQSPSLAGYMYSTFISMMMAGLPLSEMRKYCSTKRTWIRCTSTLMMF